MSTFTALISFTIFLVFLNAALAAEDCVACADGAIPIWNGNPPTKNGCGSGWYSPILNQVVTSLTIMCCNGHDICYGTCGYAKTTCDTAFSSCLKTMCDNFPEEGICIRGIMSFFVEKFGCSAYTGAQGESCICTPLG
ncbi:group XIIA secretory phospholipase A2 [Folsomia candida]|uniref:group XIIA secretory phospholipase A2 n=1 Tax=Folsomia candida TaxID=158441 RepID=UPI000B8F8388|nr:group XIIA secretory phospholipase A2 [Folsomia candida]